MEFWGDFKAKTEATRGGRGVLKSKIKGDVVYGCSLTKVAFGGHSESHAAT